MYPATFEMVLSLIGPALNATSTITGKKPISAEKQLYIALWFMSTPDSYRYVKPSCALCSCNHYYIIILLYCIQLTLSLVVPNVCTKIKHIAVI